VFCKLIEPLKIHQWTWFEENLKSANGKIPHQLLEKLKAAQNSPNHYCLFSYSPFQTAFG